MLGGRSADDPVFSGTIERAVIVGSVKGIFGGPGDASEVYDLALDPDELWPPNHTMRAIEAISRPYRIELTVRGTANLDLERMLGMRVAVEDKGQPIDREQIVFGDKLAPLVLPAIEDLPKLKIEPVRIHRPCRLDKPTVIPTSICR